MAEKYCPRCQKTLPVESFTPRGGDPTKRSSYCRPCANACRGTKVGGEKICPDCGQTFFAQRQTQRVCSRSCKQTKRDQAGDKNPNWKGVHIGTRGYAYILQPGHPRAMKSGYVKRADLVAEQMLGRPLEPLEVVHHRNHDKLDDRPENLQVLTHADHSRLHGKENVHHLHKKAK